MRLLLPRPRRNALQLVYIHVLELVYSCTIQNCAARLIQKNPRKTDHYHSILFHPVHWLPVNWERIQCKTNILCYKCIMYPAASYPCVWLQFHTTSCTPRAASDTLKFLVPLSTAGSRVFSVFCPSTWLTYPYTFLSLKKTTTSLGLFRSNFTTFLFEKTKTKNNHNSLPPPPPLPPLHFVLISSSAASPCSLSV